LIGVKKITGGALQDSLFVNGVAFKKTFSYAGFEQQPKKFTNPKIVCLNVELELKSEKDNAEVRVEQVSEYQAIVDAEWQIIFNKMEALYKTGAKVVLSKLPIGDLATQYFADRDVFCAGRVASDDLERVCLATGASIQSTCSDIQEKHLGTCELFEERQIGGERYNFFEGCPAAKTCTLVLRGGAEQFIAEVERSLHDAIMIVKRAIKNKNIVAGGGACEMEISSYLHAYADKDVPHKQQAIIKAFAKALEVIPRQLCDNAGFDATDILNRLRVEHKKGNIWAGVDFLHEGIANNMETFVWEPSLIKINAIQAATEAACLILSVDETIRKTPFLSVSESTDRYDREPGVTTAPSTGQAATPWRSAESVGHEGPWPGHAQAVKWCRIEEQTSPLMGELDTYEMSIVIKKKIQIVTKLQCQATRFILRR
jgi:T-complex protein 1 subunit eta